MARYFSHGDITSRELPPVQDVFWLAGRIADLAPFRSGSAVLCGSVAWGTPTERSDIDIAHFATAEHPHIESEIQEVVAQYEARTNHRYVAPRIDVITIGVGPQVTPEERDKSPSNGDAPEAVGVSITETNESITETREKGATIFPDTFVRFTDHIGSLAHYKGGAWKKFLDNHLSPPRKDYRDIQRDAIRSYITNTTSAWEAQPLHPFNLDANHELTQKQLDLLGQTENYAVNLMRRILGDMGRYPRPDRIADVRKAFEELPDTWAKRLATDAAPFFLLDAQYKSLVADARKSGLTAADYVGRLSALFEALPLARIQEATWEYLDQR